MGHLDPIAYTFEADWHCPACTEERFGRGPGGWIAEESEDSEGNPVHAVAPWDEWWEPTDDTCQTLGCSDCGGEIDVCHADPHSPDCADYDPESSDPYDDDPNDFDETDGPIPVGTPVTAAGYRGVAWRVDRYDRDGFAICHMVGDDRPFSFDADDLTVITEDDYCPGCGQTGCGHYRGADA